MGYNGANNTGSETRLLSIIDDVRAVLGPKAVITVPSLNPPNLRRYLKETPYQKIAPIPSVYFFALKRLVRENDIVILVEGSCYMDTWTSALLWAFLWTSKYASKYNKPSLAYAVDSGKLSPANQRRVKRDASKTNLIITRTNATKKHLESIGVSAPIEVTADTAFTFQMDPADKDLLQQIWPEAKGNAIGLAIIDFHLWPVIIRLWGRKEHCYRWPYYFSRSKDRCDSSEELAYAWAAEADRIIMEHNKSIALICMEQLDEPLVKEVHHKMKHSHRARVFSSREYNGSQMTAILRDLKLLVTSRYHAGILSLASAVPQIAVGHDTRLKRFYQELGLFKDYFIEQGKPGMWRMVTEKVDNLLENPNIQREKLVTGYNNHLSRAKRNRELLSDFIYKHGWSVKR